MIQVLGKTLLSRPFWIIRIFSACILITLIWRTNMDATDMIYCTPTEYGPTLVMIGLIIGALITFIIGAFKLSETNKDKLRAGSITEAIGYGFNYLTGNILTVIIAALACLIVPGMYFSGAEVVPTIEQFELVGIVAAVVVGLGGDVLIRTFIDFLSNRKKIAEELNAIKSETTTTETAAASATSAVPTKPKN